MSKPPYSLFWRKVENDAAPYCVENNISILAYSPLAQGLLTGKFDASHKFQEGDNRADNQLFKGENMKRAQQALDKLRPIAEKHQCSLAQLSLAWLIAQPQSNAIAGARIAEHVISNAKAAEVKLSQDELKQIDEIGKTVTSHHDDSPVMWNW